MLRNGETAIGWRYTTRRTVSMPRPEESSAAVSLTALMEHVHCDGATLSGRKISLLMPWIVPNARPKIVEAPLTFNFWRMLRCPLQHCCVEKRPINSM